MDEVKGKMLTCALAQGDLRLIDQAASALQLRRSEFVRGVLVEKSRHVLLQQSQGQEDRHGETG